MKAAIMAVAALAACLLMIGCYDEVDVITIKNDGSVTFNSKVTFGMELSKALKPKDEAEIRPLFEPAEGWKVSQHTISREHPVSVGVNGEGNLKTSKSNGPVFTVSKLSETTYALSFEGMDFPEGKGSKKVRFTTHYAEGDAKVFDASGKLVDGVENIAATPTMFTVVLK